MDRPFFPASEREGLDAVLDRQRDALVRKVTGLTDSQARQTPTAGQLSLLALLKHCAVWEVRWSQAVVAGAEMPDGWPDRGDDDAEFVLGPDDTVDLWLRRYADACAASRAVSASTDLDAPCLRPDVLDGNLRGVLLHLIEETARHAGHADLIREAVDGQRGL